jgi:hypothetical protein
VFQVQVGALTVIAKSAADALELIATLTKSAPTDRISVRDMGGNTVEVSTLRSLVAPARGLKTSA